jgi:hypothetical protein
MNKFLFAAAALALAAPAASQTPIRVGTFDAIELRGVGELVIRHGAEQRVTLLEGDRALAGFEVDEQGTLVIRACRTSCRNQRLRVEIVTPEVEAVAIHGGGAIRIERGFPAGDNLAVAVHGGGAIDARALPARNVAAAVSGGGSIRTAPGENLAASIRGGGAILYTGDPETAVSVRGGGAVSRER